MQTVQFRLMQKLKVATRTNILFLNLDFLWQLLRKILGQSATHSEAYMFGTYMLFGKL
jgi:hypothetical protein